MADKKKLIDVASVATKLFIRYASPALAEDAKTLELPDNKYWGFDKIIERCKKSKTMGKRIAILIIGLIFVSLFAGVVSSDKITASGIQTGNATADDTVNGTHTAYNLNKTLATIATNAIGDPYLIDKYSVYTATIVNESRDNVSIPGIDYIPSNQEERDTVTDRDMTRSLSDTVPATKDLDFVPGELIVKFKPGVNEKPPISTKNIATIGYPSIDLLNEQYGVTSLEKAFKTVEKPVVKGLPDLSNVYILELPKGADILSITKVYQKNPNVEYAEPNYIYHTCAVPNDPYYSQQWAHQNMQSERAWDIETGDPSVVIAIVDTGVDWDHPDLAANVWNNTAEILDGADTDGNGYIDDIRGWDFVDISSGCYPGEDCDGVRDNDPMDFHGHGTLCSGIAGAVTDNSIGIAGMSWNCKLMAVRVGYVRADGGGYIEYDDSAAGIIYAADNNASVICMSWCGYSRSNLIVDAIDYAYSKGVVLIAAAGNCNTNCLLYPAGYDKVIAISATDITDAKAWFSSYGSWIDVAAPGVNIKSTLFNDTYATRSGTTMSTPFVAGLVGLILSKNPGFSHEEVRTILHSTTDNVTASQYIGLGRINAYKAVQRDSTPIAYLNFSLDDAPVGEFIQLTGTASGTKFKNYSIYYGQGVYPASWTLINNSTSQVINGVLASWNTTDLTDENSYTIKLNVIDTSNNVSEDRVIVNFSTKLKWTYIIVPFADAFTNILSSPAIDLERTLYIGSYDHKLYAIYPNGTLKWRYTTGDVVSSSPLIGSDGIIYVGSWDKNLYAIHPNSTLKWSYTTGGIVNSSPAIGPNGTIYVGSGDHNVYAIHHNGTRKWNYTTGSQVQSPITIGSDGTIYAGCDDYNVYAIYPNGTRKWNYTAGGAVTSSPTIGADGTIYVGSCDHNVYAIYPNGTRKWNYTTGGTVTSSPTIGADGTIYVGSCDHNVYAIYPNGTLNWKYTTDHSVHSSPAISTDKTIYVGSDDHKFYAIYPNGTLNWKYTTQGPVKTQPAIGLSGTIYVGSCDGMLYAFKSGVTDTTPPLITFVPPTPANNSEVNVNYVFVNVTLNEYGNTAILNWNGTNETMNGAGMNFYLNKTGMSNGKYTYKVYANDTSNNWNHSETRIAKVNVTLPDTTPPASITNLTNTTGTTWINWTWNNPLDADFNHSMVYLDGLSKTNTSNPFYVATGLTPNVYYEIGTHTVDKVGNVNETWINQTVKIQAPADLIISGIWMNWPHNCTIYYNVTNVGNGTAPAGHNTSLYVDDVKVALDYVPEELASGENYTGCFDGYIWTYTPPEDNITVCADNNNTVEESNETNNCMINTWMCGDVNADGTVNVLDVLGVYRRALDPSYPLAQPWAADVNCDGTINVLDVLGVYRRALDPGYYLGCCCE